MASITIGVQSMLNTAVYNSYTLADTTTVSTLKDYIYANTSVVASWYSLYINGTEMANANTLASYGITANTRIRSANKISRLPTRENRQYAKLELASLDRAASNHYSVYDILTLPTQFGNNTIVDNPNVEGLLLGRPWLGAAVLILAPETLVEAIPPSVFVSLESWYDASDSSVFTPNNPADGATFTQWADKSAFAHNANPIGGATTRATYQVNEQNTLSVVRFDGNDGLSINPYSNLSSAADITVFVVMKMTATAGDPAVFITNGDGTGLTYDTAAGKFVVKAAAGTGVSTVVNNATGFHIHSFAYDGTQTGNDNRLKYRYDKSDITLTFSGTVGSTLSVADNTLYIGNNNSANFYTGDIAELLIFTRALTPIEIQNVENYLSTKWGL